MYNQQSGSIGFSSRINDPAFTKYLKNTTRWSTLFAFILSVAAIISFYIYGEQSSEMDNPQALYIGLGIGGMFMLLALLQTMGRKKSKTWDGTVVDKKAENKRRRKYTTDNDFYWVDYIEYVVMIKENGGKIHEIAVADDDTLYYYYKIGDHVRHHAGLNSYEKYDKSGDNIVFCNACASLNDITNDVCYRCNCPLLK